MDIIYRKDQKYTFGELKRAVKEHATTKMFCGYKCEAHGNYYTPYRSANPDCECIEFKRIEEEWGIKNAISTVRTRLRLKINLTGWNTQDQSEWTY